MESFEGLSKAQMLLRLSPLIGIFKIPRLIAFSRAELDKLGDSALLEIIKREFGESTLIVRSSAADEDGAGASLAGAYESVPGLSTGKPHQLLTAIEQVVGSYRKKGNIDANNEIIVQLQVKDVYSSGVIFTHDLNTGAPYYVINYDDVSGLTSTVTSGASEYSNRTLCIHRGSYSSLRSERFQKILSAVRELEKVIGSDFLDIEFAMDKSLVPYLLQVRPITTQPNWNRSISQRIGSELEGIKKICNSKDGTYEGCLWPFYCFWPDARLESCGDDWKSSAAVGIHTLQKVDH